MARYINPYTDFGFKKLFGEEGNKNLLIDFLNQLLPAHHQIEDLTFQNNENSSDVSEERKVFFDIHCKSKTGERFIVEMQKSKIDFFKDRTLYYLTYPIREQAQRGDWSFKLNAVYFVAILDFWFEDKKKAEFYHYITLKNQNNQPFYDKLGLIYLQMPAFTKTENELETKFDKWMYLLKNLNTMEAIPQILNEQVFQQVFQIAELANMTMEQRYHYERSRLNYIENKLVTETAIKEAVEEATEKAMEKGLEKGLEKAVLGMRQIGVPQDKIAEALNISVEQVASIINNIQQ